MLHSSEKYAWIFDQEMQGEKLSHERVGRYRARTIRAGDQLEVEIYPLWDTGAEARTAKCRATGEAQRNVNARNARKRLERLLNANFTREDLSLTLTYGAGVPNLAQARRDMQNFVRRVKAAYKRLGLPSPKYVYVMEYGSDGRKKRVHHHMVLSGGMDRDALEALWKHGRANADRLKPDEYGLTALARYITKESHGGKRWAASRNLKKPRITVSDTKISRRRVEQMAEDMECAAPAIFTKLFPDYVYTDCVIRRSDFVSGAYVYARMVARSAYVVARAL